MSEFDLAYKNLSELPTDTAAPASGDFLIRWDAAIKKFVKVGATDLSTLLGVDATAAEITRAADVSARLIAAGAALTLTVAAHDGKTILLDTAAGSTVTLPAASGSGAIFKFCISTTATSNSHIIKVANASDTMKGLISALSDGVDNMIGWLAAAASDTITFNRTTTGTAAVGQYVEIQDIATNVFAVSGLIAQTGTEATPFSATV